jgi:hypothetical protein
MNWIPRLPRAMRNLKVSVGTFKLAVSNYT